MELTLDNLFLSIFEQSEFSLDRRRYFEKIEFEDEMKKAKEEEVKQYEEKLEKSEIEAKRWKEEFMKASDQVKKASGK